MKLELPGRENRNSKLNQPSDWKPVQGVVKHSFWLNGREVLEAKLAGSVQFSHSVVPDSLRPHESQHARPPCPSPTSGVYSNSCPLSQ